MKSIVKRITIIAMIISLILLILVYDVNAKTEENNFTQEQIKYLMKKKEEDRINSQKIEEEYFKNLGNRKEMKANAHRTNSLGETGDILITYKGEGTTWFHGHAAIVSKDKDKTVEAFKNSGVVERENDWNKLGSRHYRVKKSQEWERRIAALWAKSYIGKPYEVSFNKWRTDKFYCSQLVWRAWYNAGTNLAPSATLLVTPHDLEKGETDLIRIVW